VLGAINGPAITGGMEMALGCDFLVASDQAVFADTHARVGILPGAGMTARLPCLVGAGMARRLSMTGEVIDAARAEAMGLVTEVVAHTQLLDRTVEVATQVCEVDAPVMQGLKAITWPALPRSSSLPWPPSRLSPPPPPGIPTAWASVIDKSQNVTDGRSAGRPKVDSLL
jgi:enoyl-CoA hydratase/carnithine racemase